MVLGGNSHRWKPWGEHAILPLPHPSFQGLDSLHKAALYCLGNTTYSMGLSAKCVKQGYFMHLSGSYKFKWDFSAQPDEGLRCVLLPSSRFFLLLKFTSRNRVGSFLRFVPVRKWFGANSASLGSSSEPGWWYTQVQEEPVTQPGSWLLRLSKYVTALWNLCPHKLPPCLCDPDISRSLGNEGNLKYPRSTFYGINLTVPSALEIWGICKDALLPLATW